METNSTSKAIDSVRFQLVDLSRRTSLDIDSDAFDDARRDYLFNQAALATEEKYALVLQNYVQFESTLYGIALNHLVFSTNKWSDFVDGIQLVNGSLLNLLSSTKAYLDQVPQHLNDIFGKGSAQATAFEKLTNKEFDERFEYRVISGLRNHLQHGDFPVKWLEFSSDWKRSEGEKESCAHKIAAYLSIDDLLKSDKFRALTRDELKALGKPRLDVKPLVRAYVSSIARLHCSVRSSTQEKEHPAEERVRDLIIRARDSAIDNMPLGLSVVAFSDKGQELEKIPVFTDNIDRRKHLQMHSSVITNLEKHFVSAEPIPTKDR